MLKTKVLPMTICGICAGAINGLFGAGGGMVLVPLLTCLTFPAGNVPWNLAIPYLISSAAGGVLAGLLGKKIPTLWLHKLLGILILWGGVRYLC